MSPLSVVTVENRCYVTARMNNLAHTITDYILISAPLPSVYFAEETSVFQDVYLRNVTCTDIEKRLEECIFHKERTCGDFEEVGIICTILQRELC